MTKAELIDKVAESVEGFSKAQIAQVYEAIFISIAQALKEGDKQRFAIKDFGTFEVKKRDARKGRNPKTGEDIEIAAKTTVKFRPSGQLEEYLG